MEIDWDNFFCEAKYYNCLENENMPEVVYSDAVLGFDMSDNKRKFVLCRNIFNMKDYMKRDIYVDVEGRILETDEDFYKIFSKQYSYQAFLMIHKPLFMEWVKALHASLS